MRLNESCGSWRVTRGDVYVRAYDRDADYAQISTGKRNEKETQCAF